MIAALNKGSACVELCSIACVEPNLLVRPEPVEGRPKRDGSNRENGSTGSPRTGLRAMRTFHSTANATADPFVLSLSKGLSSHEPWFDKLSKNEAKRAMNIAQHSRARPTPFVLSLSKDISRLEQ